MQTYPETEVIVVDGSSDYETSEVIRYFKNKITVVKDKRNIGVSAARNIGIKASSGNYITFLDDDDFFHPRKIERQIKLFDKEEKIGLIYCPVAIKKSNELIYKPLRKKNNHWIRLTYQNPIIMTPLIKKECFSACGIFDESLLYHEDRDLWYRIGKKFQFEFNNDPDYIWYNLNIDRLSTQIEKICNNKKILYDFADIESHDPDGKYFLDKGCNDNCDYDSNGDGSIDRNWAEEWIAGHPKAMLTRISKHNKCDQCAHSKRLNCVLKGIASWWLWARLAGW